jgi:hypothetical protein
MRALAVVVVLVSVAVAAAYSQNRPVDVTHGSGTSTAVDPFNGTWKMNRAKSRQSRGEPPTFETVTIRVEDGIQHTAVEFQNVGSSAPSKYRYDVKYNDGQWHAQDGPSVAQPNGVAMIVKVDDRTHYRITRDATGKATGVMMRRLAADGKTYVTTIMSPEGEVTLVKFFEKQ